MDDRRKYYEELESLAFFSCEGGRVRRCQQQNWTEHFSFQQCHHRSYLFSHDVLGASSPSCVRVCIRGRGRCPTSRTQVRVCNGIHRKNQYFIIFCLMDFMGYRRTKKSKFSKICSHVRVGARSTIIYGLFTSWVNIQRSVCCSTDLCLAKLKSHFNINC